MLIVISHVEFSQERLFHLIFLLLTSMSRIKGASLCLSWLCKVRVIHVSLAVLSLIITVIVSSGMEMDFNYRDIENWGGTSRNSGLNGIENKIAQWMKLFSLLVD